MKKLFAALLAALFCLYCLPGSLVDVTGQEQVVRVGYPIQKGLTEVDASGQYSGYTYDYLEEIAQYTGWDYEFVQVPGDINTALSTMMEMLKQGELDLLGGMNYNDTLAEMFEYPENNYGKAYTTLCALEDNTAITSNNYQTVEPLRIAILKNADTQNKRLEEFCRTNGLAPELVYCDDFEGQMSALQNSTADLLLSIDVNSSDGLRTILKFSPRPFYFASTKGNTDLIQRLNEALVKIDETDPYFAPGLYEKYFGNEPSKLFLSDEEQAYIQKKKWIDVALLVGKAPIQFLDEKSGEIRGISKDILRYIEEQTGLAFRYHTAHTSGELTRLVQDGKVELVAGINCDQETAAAYQVSNTRPYLDIQITMVLNKRIDPDKLAGKRLAIPSDLFYSGEYMGDVQRYDTMEQCLHAVETGDADYCYANGNTAQFYANRQNYRNITLIPQTSTSQSFCFGLPKPADLTLLTIINKAILSIPESDLQAIVYQNTADTGRTITLSSFVNANPWQAIGILCGFTLLVILLLLWILYIRSKSSKRIALENERYNQLCDLTNECLFELDHQKDRLRFSGNSAERFFRLSGRERYLVDSEQRYTGFTEADNDIMKKIQAGAEGTFELQYIRSEGQSHWIRVTCKVIRDKLGSPIVTIGKVIDIQEEKERMERLEEKAQIDGLTGVLNAASFRQLTEENLTGGGTLLIMDIDRFKEVNDRYGHFTGDQVLKEAVRLIQLAFVKDGIIGRLGGDEFLVFLVRETSKDNVSHRCEALRESVKGRRSLPAITMSIGAATVSEHEGYESLYKRADAALYRVKENGRDGYEIAKP